MEFAKRDHDRIGMYKVPILHKPWCISLPL
jgi:hypothetical protein